MHQNIYKAIKRTIRKSFERMYQPFQVRQLISIQDVLMDAGYAFSHKIGGKDTPYIWISDPITEDPFILYSIDQKERPLLVIGGPLEGSYSVNELARALYKHYDINSTRYEKRQFMMLSEYCKKIAKKHNFREMALWDWSSLRNVIEAGFMYSHIYVKNDIAIMISINHDGTVRLNRLTILEEPLMEISEWKSNFVTNDCPGMFFDVPQLRYGFKPMNKREVKEFFKSLR